jgi:hypothetical protein
MGSSVLREQMVPEVLEGPVAFLSEVASGGAAIVRNHGVSELTAMTGSLRE